MPAAIPQLPPPPVSKKPAEIQPPKPPSVPTPGRDEPRFRDVLDGAKRQVKPKPKEPAAKSDQTTTEAKSDDGKAAGAETGKAPGPKLRGKGKEPSSREKTGPAENQVAGEAAASEHDDTDAEKIAGGDMFAAIPVTLTETADGPVEDNDDQSSDLSPAELPSSAGGAVLCVTQCPAEAVKVAGADLPSLVLSEGCLGVSESVAAAIPTEIGYDDPQTVEASDAIDATPAEPVASGASETEQASHTARPQSIAVPSEIQSRQPEITPLVGETPAAETRDGGTAASGIGTRAIASSDAASANASSEPDDQAKATTTTYAVTESDSAADAGAGNSLPDPAAAHVPTHKPDQPSAPKIAFQQSAPIADLLEARFAESNHPRIVTAVQSELMPSGGTVRLRLDPPELGALQVRIEVRDGVVAASFQTSNDEATRLLTQSLQRLKTTLESQGVTVEKLHVQQTPREQWDGGRGGNGDERQQHSPQHWQQQEQQRREMLQRMWRRVRDGRDPFDLVA